MNPPAIPVEPSSESTARARKMLTDLGVELNRYRIRTLALGFDAAIDHARRGVGKEISALGKGLRGIQDGQVIGFALSDIGSRLESGHPVEDIHPGVVDI